MSELETQISKSDSQNELVTDRGHFSNITFVLDCFKEDSQDSIRAVHFLKDNASFFENLSKTQFYAIYKLVPEKIRYVKRLIVFTSDDECHLPTSSKIIRFHANTSGYGYKVIRTDQYYELLKLELHGASDFVIYGDKYLFFPQHQPQEDLQVMWSKDKESIQRHINFFENTWNSKFTSVIDEPSLKQPISIDDLFNPAT